MPQLTCVLLFAVPASGLSNLRLAIPETAARGSDVAFNCSFNLQDDDLYAVKWYRGTYEIFRQGYLGTIHCNTTIAIKQLAEYVHVVRKMI